MQQRSPSPLLLLFVLLLVALVLSAHLIDASSEKKKNKKKASKKQDEQENAEPKAAQAPKFVDGMLSVFVFTLQLSPQKRE